MRAEPRQEEKGGANSWWDEQLVLFGNSGGCVQRVWDKDGRDLEVEGRGQLRCQA